MAKTSASVEKNPVGRPASGKVRMNIFVNPETRDWLQKNGGSAAIDSMVFQEIELAKIEKKLKKR